MGSHAVLLYFEHGGGGGGGCLFLVGGGGGCGCVGKGWTQALFILFNSQPLKLISRSPSELCITNAQQHKQPV